MRQRLRSKLTYANVMSTLAVALVIGGGTASAIIVYDAPAGFNAVKGIQTPRTVLGVPGVGTVTASCGRAGIVIHWKNRTPQGQLVFVDPGGSREPTGVSLGSGEERGIIVFGAPDPYEMVHVQAVRPGNGGTPMAEVGIVINWRGDCATATVAAHSESSE